MTQTINLGPEVYVTDPCYSVPTWCQKKLTNVLPGEWVVSMIYDELGGSNRNAELYLIHKDYQSTRGLSFDWLGDFGVDSGQAGVFDAASYRDDAYAAGITRPKLRQEFFLPGELTEGDAWYETICHFTLEGDGWGTYAAGAVSSSGYGDGMYPVYGAEVDGKIVALQLVFISQEEEDEDDWDDDESDCCDECGGELESDGTCDYCEYFENSKKED
jgi:hypothetical protein